MSDRLIVVSGDCHADPAAPEDFAPYVEARHRDEFDAWVAQQNAGTPGMEQFFSDDHVQQRLESPIPEGTEHESELRKVRLATGLAKTSDPDVRLKELEADGVVAEVIFPNAMPMRDIDGRSEGSLAGRMIYNRWLADLCQAHPGRRVGVAQLPPVTDVAETVTFLEWAKGAGLNGVTCPSPDKELPPLIDAYYEPVWEACEALELPLHAHIGWGGAFVDDMPFMSIMSAAGRGVVGLEILFLSRRALWLLTYSGVFERHPGLKLVFVEQGAEWVPDTLRRMDAIYHDYQRGHPIRAELPREPSEYWRRQCFVVASSLSVAEVALRDEIGVETMMFGTDYPHFEATWPNSREWLAMALEGVPEGDIRMILGENGLRCYSNLDPAELAAAAAECGPSIEALTRGRADIDAETQQWLEQRGVLDSVR